jgi:pimeloyl-ACP methyl ester carboxylesterase
VLLTEGVGSPPLFEPVLERLAAALPRTERHRFAEAGHLPHITHPDQYAEVVANFASRITRHSADVVSTARQ